MSKMVYVSVKFIGSTQVHSVLRRSGSCTFGNGTLRRTNLRSYFNGDGSCPAHGEVAREERRGSGEGCRHWVKLSLQTNLILICCNTGTESLTTLLMVSLKQEEEAVLCVCSDAVRK